jgi:hypothetical protein
MSTGEEEKEWIMEERKERASQSASHTPNNTKAAMHRLVLLAPAEARI